MSKVRLNRTEKNLILGILKGKRADLRARLEYMMDDYDDLNTRTPITEALKEQIEIVEAIIPKLEKHFNDSEHVEIAEHKELE